MSHPPLGSGRSPFRYGVRPDMAAGEDGSGIVLAQLFFLAFATSTGPSGRISSENLEFLRGFEVSRG
jgi:hypothetical protein